MERIPSAGRGLAGQFVPIRFVFRNKLHRDDRLLLAFDALVISKAFNRDVALGRIIYGDDQATLDVKTSALMAEVEKLAEEIAALISSQSPPDLVLNRHCVECEFQTRCRQKAIDKDDLSLLGSITAKQRADFNSKGIFTVKQLSFTFRPRRRPKQLKDKREKYHYSLKALAIRERKVHVVGSPEIKIVGTPVYFDVESLPDRGFYYLIGMRIKAEGSAIHYSLWADGPADEGRIWREFLSKLREIENPVLIHYSSFESAFLMRMCEKYGGPPDGSATAKAIKSPVNILSVIFGQIYFPTYSNGLKEIAGWLGFRWSDRDPSGVQSIVWRDEQVEETTADYDRQVYPNLAGQMVLTSINQLWVADITYIRLETEFVYLAVVIDAFSRRVIGWALDRTVEDELTLTAFRMALELRRPPAGWVYHSDRGSQYASGDYTDLLQAHGCEISMSHKASPWENAGCESWMKSLKYEEVYRQEYRDLVEARASIARFIDKVYNQKRLHSALGYRPPVEFEQALLVSSGAAARA